MLNFKAFLYFLIKIFNENRIEQRDEVITIIIRFNFIIVIKFNVWASITNDNPSCCTYTGKTQHKISGIMQNYVIFIKKKHKAHHQPKQNLHDRRNEFHYEFLMTILIIMMSC